MVEALTIIDNRPKRRARKRESQTIKRIECVPILIKKTRGKRKSDIAKSDPTRLPPRELRHRDNYFRTI